MAMKLFIMAGQSNMEGRAAASEFPTDLVTNGSRIWNYKMNATWVQNPPEPIHVKAGGTYPVLGGASGVSPCLMFADHFARYHTTMDVGLVPAAKGGTTIGDWARIGAGTDTTTPYGAMRARWEAALASQPGSTIAGFAWWQGESDALTLTGANAWAAGFIQLCADVRSDIGNANLPIVFVQIGPRKNEGSNPEWTVAQDNQAAIVGPGRTMMISAKGMTLLNETDTAHLGTSSMLIMGRRFADAFRVLGAGL